MKYYNVIFSLLLLQCSYACGNTTKNNSQKSPEKDICSVSSEIKYPILFEYDKKYPQRELTLHDIADITYSKFSDKDVLFDQGAGGNLSISDQFKIIHNPKEGTIFVFDKIIN